LSEELQAAVARMLALIANPQRQPNTNQGQTLQYPLAVIGDDSVIVSSNPPGIICGSKCSALFPVGSSVSLSIDKVPGSKAISWTGCSSATISSCVVQMTGPQKAKIELQ
jgi:hypothetical protein